MFKLATVHTLLYLYEVSRVPQNLGSHIPKIVGTGIVDNIGNVAQTLILNSKLKQWSDLVSTVKMHKCSININKR